MSRRLGMARLLRQSLLHRRARSLSALIALTVSAAVATALLTLYADLDAKLHHEFRSFGANVVVTEPTPEPDFAAKAEQAAGPGVLSAAFAYAVATTDRGTPVVVSGVDFPAVQKLDSWWQLPAWPTGPNDALLGTRAADFIGNENSVTLTFANKPMTFHGAGRLKTGGDEDSRIYLPIAAFMALTGGQTGVQPNVVEMQVTGGHANIEASHRPSPPGLTRRLRSNPSASSSTANPASSTAPTRSCSEPSSSLPSLSQSPSSPPSPPASSSAAATSPS